MVANISGSSGDGGWALDFGTPVDGIGFWTTDTQFAGTVITFRDAMGQVLDTGELFWPHPFETVFQGWVSTETQIARVEVVNHPIDFITHDNLQYGFVPEPSAGLLLGLGALGLVRRRRSHGEPICSAASAGAGAA